MMLMLVAALTALQAEEPRRTFGPPTDRSFSQARSALDEVLLDYPSARFRDVTAHELTVCGKVNAKNRMGAYVGWSDFVVSLAGEPTAFVGDEIMTDALCNDTNRPRSPDYSARMTARR